MAGARRKTRTQPNLTAERVRDEALRLIEAEGLEEFSTRKLGRALGVEAMAIYWYYPSKEKLLDAVVEQLVSSISDIVPGSKPPTDFIDAMRKLAHGYRGLAHAYPSAFPLLAMRRFGTERAYGFLEGLFTMARAYGLDDRATARWYRLVASYCGGVALDELAGVREMEEKDDAERDRSRFPRVAGVFAWLGPEHYEDVFSFGLEVLLDAIAASVRPSAGTQGAAQSAGQSAKAKAATRRAPASPKRSKAR